MTPGQAHDLDGADVLLPQLDVEKLLADRAYDADNRVLNVLSDMGVEAVIPSKKNRIVQRVIDKD